jgi:hypothetical protein
MIVNRTAASETLLEIGPILSWWEEIGITVSSQ